MPPKHRLLGLALRSSRAAPPSPTPRSHLPQSHTTQANSLSTTSRKGRWDGRPASEHAAREGDTHNLQHDAVKGGKAERAKGEGSGERATSERDGGSAAKAREEFPEAPDTVGMQDERGGKNQ
ncbi:hypothetical protein BJ875DRAFT_457131 [Amylocarpus encephaloides]|uniref:Uncharacterized protein n=1 Tax=Amylocarpus encephaloides TaxID=45428 RepID=A0A9P7YM67_9HELO|nr:hypothetical protein BJ875DRAFT_457131 [Amylocarpus encephaloides]